MPHETCSKLMSTCTLRGFRRNLFCGLPPGRRARRVLQEAGERPCNQKIKRAAPCEAVLGKRQLAERDGGNRMPGRVLRALVGAALVAMALAPIPAAAQEKIIVKLGWTSSDGPNDPYAVAARTFKEELETRS